MQARRLMLLAGVGLVAGFTLAMAVDGEPQASQPRADPAGPALQDEGPGRPGEGEPRSAWMYLDARQPYRAELSRRGSSSGNPTVGVNATPVENPWFGSIARALGEGTGPPARGPWRWERSQLQRRTGPSSSSPGPNRKCS